VSGSRLLLQAIAEDRAYLRLVFTRAPMLRAAGGGRAFEQNFAVLRRIFGAQQRAGELRDDLPAQEIAEHYVTLFNATVTRWFESDEAPDALFARVDRALGILFRGLAREGGAA
jgi:hypothetical protein